MKYLLVLILPFLVGCTNYTIGQKVKVGDCFIFEKNEILVAKVTEISQREDGKYILYEYASNVGGLDINLKIEDVFISYNMEKIDCRSFELYKLVFEMKHSLIRLTEKKK